MQGVADGKSLRVATMPVSLGYSRRAGAQLTIGVFADFLRKVWRDKIVFRKPNLPNPTSVPIRPNTVIEDSFGFTGD
jgi:hypothetical protein